MMCQYLCVFPSGRPRVEVEVDAYVEGQLATEASMIVLDTLEIIVGVGLLHYLHNIPKLLWFGGINHKTFKS